MIPPVDVAGRTRHAVLRDLPRVAEWDADWVRRLIEPAGLPDGLVGLLALEAAVGTTAPTPCLRAWLALLDASVGGDLTAATIREALALAVDGRQIVRDLRWESAGAPLVAADAVQAIVAEAALAAQSASQLANRLPNCLLVER
ncbi:MAG: hypothetical protein U0556_05295 [Dehalococcoidia bacterium]